MKRIDMILLGVLIAVFCLYFLQSRVRTLVAARRLERCGRDQKKALALLEEEGYRLGRVDPSVKTIQVIGARKHMREMTVPMTVRRRLSRYAVLLHKGDKTRLTTVAGQKENLLHGLLFPVDGIVHVQLGNGRITRVDIDKPRAHRLLRRCAPLLLLLVATGGYLAGRMM